MTIEKKTSLLLSFVSGFIDTAGFIALSHLFTAHVTGNLVLVGASFFDNDGFAHNMSKILMLPVFLVGVGFTSYLIKYKNATLKDLILAESIFLMAFSLAGYLIYRMNVQFTDWAIAGVASLAVLGLSIQNTYMKKLLPKYIPNTVMTGNFTQFSADLFSLTDHYIKKTVLPPVADIRNSINRMGAVLLGFVSGCFFGGLLVKFAGLICCLLAPALLLVLYFQIGNQDSSSSEMNFKSKT